MGLSSKLMVDLFQQPLLDQLQDPARVWYHPSDAHARRKDVPLYIPTGKEMRNEDSHIFLRKAQWMFARVEITESLLHPYINEQIQKSGHSYRRLRK